MNRMIVLLLGALLSTGALAKLPEVRKWQARVLGEELVAAVAG